MGDSVVSSSKVAEGSADEATHLSLEIKSADDIPIWMLLRISAWYPLDPPLIHLEVAPTDKEHCGSYHIDPCARRAALRAAVDVVRAASGEPCLVSLFSAVKGHSERGVMRLSRKKESQGSGAAGGEGTSWQGPGCKARRLP